jgi:sarcosine oxidase
MARYDAIVLGLGAMGSAAAFQLARRGARVLGIDRFEPPHALGSTHGDTRVTRLAIGEGEHLTPLVIRSHEIWREIERETGANLLTANGGLVISSDAPTSVTHVAGFFANTVAAARRFRIAHELLDAAAIRKRFPNFRVRDNEVGYFEPAAGFVRPEACVAAQLVLARRHGADIRTGERVMRFEESSSGVTVVTEKANHEADRLIVAAGPWLPEFLGGAQAGLFRIFRQVLFWFDIEEPAEQFAPDRFPIFIWELQGARQGIYGFPAIDGSRGGIKVATEEYAAVTTPDAVSRTVDPREISAMYDCYVAPNLSGVRPTCAKSAVCLYTVTPDFGFVIDWLPGSKRIVVASPCSGHGFKHSATVGEILAELVVDGRSRFELAPFAFQRFVAT